MKTDESSKPLGTVTRPEGSPDLKAVLDHQAALGAAQKEVAALTALIDDLEAKARTELAQIPSDAYLQEELENLHAAAALGKIKRDELEKRDLEISKARERFVAKVSELKVAAVRHEHALNGLRRQLAIANAKVQKIEGGRKELIARLLDTEVGRACDDYVAAAEMLKKAFERMVGFERLFLALRINKKLLPLDWKSFFIPSMNLPASADREHPNWRYVLYSAEHADLANDYEKALRFEETRLQVMGVELPSGDDAAPSRIH